MQRIVHERNHARRSESRKQSEAQGARDNTQPVARSTTGLSSKQIPLATATKWRPLVTQHIALEYLAVAYEVVSESLPHLIIPITIEAVQV